MLRENSSVGKCSDCMSSGYFADRCESCTTAGCHVRCDENVGYTNRLGVSCASVEGGAEVDAVGTEEGVSFGPFGFWSRVRVSWSSVAWRYLVCV